jgi:hypothetical protein
MSVLAFFRLWDSQYLTSEVSCKPEMAGDTSSRSHDGKD